MAALPSPSTGVWQLGPLPIRAYALCIALGIVVAVFLTQRRWNIRGGNPEDVMTIVVWAVPFGIVGARIYHLITDPELYFTRGKHPLQALEIWHGGLGIWGAVAGGALGALIACRRHHISLLDFAGAVAPGLAVAQALGRWGNYFNQELYGRPSGLAWAVQIDPAHRPADTQTSPPISRPSCTNPSGTSASPHSSSGPRNATASDRAGHSPSTSPPTPPDVVGSRPCASTTPTTSSAYASTTGPHS